MGELATWLNAGWVGNFLAILGLLAAYYFYRKSLRVPELVFDQATLDLVGSDHLFLTPDIQIIFRGEVVSYVQKTWIMIWNAGSGEIRDSSIAHNAPITFHCRQGIILNASIAKRTMEANNAFLTLEHDKRSAVLSFDYLNPNDGVSIEILHSGKDSTITVGGIVIGGKRIKAARPPSRLSGANAIETLRPLPNWGWSDRLFGLLFVPAGIFLAYSTLIDIIALSQHSTWSKFDWIGLSWQLMALGGAGFLILVGSALLAFARYRPPSRLLIVQAISS